MSWNNGRGRQVPCAAAPAFLAVLGIDPHIWNADFAVRWGLPLGLSLLLLLSVTVTVLTIRRERSSRKLLMQKIQEERESFSNIEAKVGQERQRLADIIRGTNVGTWEWNVQTGETIFNERWAKIIGYTLEELAPVSIKTWLKFTHPDDVQASKEWVQKHFRGEQDFYEVEMRMTHKDGSCVWVQDRGKVTSWTEGGQPLMMMGTHTDITKRKRAEADRERLAMAIEQAAEAVFITDASGLIQYVNPAFEALTGYGREVATGQNPRILNSGKQDPPFYRAMWDTLCSGRTWHGRLVNRKKDGTHFTENTTITPILDAAGQIVSYVSVSRDITEELDLQLQLSQAQKMESVGRLAGGVAHDFNNMLCVILGHTELALEQAGPSHPLFEDLQEIRNAAGRSADLTRQLLAFARKQTVTPQLLELNETLAGMLKMLGRLIGESVQIEVLPGKELWLVKIDPSQVDQILVNLCINARDAITDVGTITFETGNCTFDTDACANHDGAEPGEYVRLSVSDSGEGMDRETLAHIFEPFFTTKPVGEGTGLGLATVYGIVKQNRGFINAYSEPGHGTAFKIYLPRHLGEAERPMGSALPPMRGHETVLLVEDEPSIMSMAQSMLARWGYTVLAAGSPSKALRMAEDYQGKISLLMTDVVMPEMNGMDLAKNLQTRWPDLKCLFMSGYTSGVLSPQGILSPGIHFIQKPFSTTDLSARLRDALKIA